MLQDRLEGRAKVSIMLYIITILNGGSVQIHSETPPATIGTMYVDFEGGGSCCVFNGYSTSPERFRVVRSTDPAYTSPDTAMSEDVCFVTLPVDISMIRYRTMEDGRLRAVGLKTSAGTYEWNGEEPDSIDKLLQSLVAA